MRKSLLSIVLSISLAAPAAAAPVFRGPGKAMTAPVLAPASAGSAAGAVKAVGYQLDHLSLRLGTVLPDVEVIQLPVQGLMPQGALAAVEFLSRETLPPLTPMGSPEASPAAASRPEAARLVGAALADTDKRELLLQALREKGGEEGGRVAKKLLAVGKDAHGKSAFEVLSREFSEGDDFESRLGALFDGGASLKANMVAAETPESFVAFAQRRFAAGRKRLGILGVPTDDELHDSVALSPLTNPERERVLVELFERGGAARDQIHLQDVGRGRNNIYVVKPGKSDRIIVVGGHHDKVRAGAGTIDNWTGATMVANLYKAMRDLSTDATIVFIGFAREEEGLLGSKAFLKNMDRAERGRIDAMINLDTLAVDGTFSWVNNSDRSLLTLIKNVAVRTGLALKEMTLWGGDSDSSTFRRYGIAGMTVMGASNDVIWDIIHSKNDTIAEFSLEHYKNAFFLTLETMKELAEKPLSRLQRVAAWWLRWFV
ncbi:MAG: hypothetical protein COB53_07085 [Elusimicrobia bacterium]|nr:MAG: hypothetical protein COB53_07085 [Elusimicrobiota bacterium]